MRLHCRKCGRFLPKAAVAGLAAGVCLVLYSFLAINVFILQSSTAEWLNNVCTPILIITVPFGILYVLLTRNEVSLCETCNLRKTLMAAKAIKTMDNARRIAVSSRKNRMETTLRADPSIIEILDELRPLRRAGWKPDEKTLILLRYARILERQSKYYEAADILERLGLDERARSMRKRASQVSNGQLSDSSAL